MDCVINGEITEQAHDDIAEKGAGPASKAATALIASELLTAERQVARLMKRLKDHFL